MAKRVRLQVAVLTAGAAFLAGCGGGGSTPATSPAPIATTGSTPTSTVSGAPRGTGSSAAIELSTCISTAARSRLSTTGKARFLSLCKHAVKGADAGVTREAAQQCAHIIKQTVPAAAQGSLISGCPKP